MGISPNLTALLLEILYALFGRLKLTTKLKESPENFGWTQRDPRFRPGPDKTKEYEEILEQIRGNDHRLPDRIFYLLVPGLFSNLVPKYFLDVKEYFINTLGLPCAIAEIDSQAGIQKNAEKLKVIVAKIFRSTGTPVLLLGHSKGGLDADTALKFYWGDLKDKVVGVVFAQSPFGGSPVASYFLRHKKSKALLKAAVAILKGDMRCVKDLTYESRKTFLSAHPNVPDVATVSFSTQAPMESRKMYELADTELPCSDTGGKVHWGLPVPHAMDVLATLIFQSYGKESDGLVARDDAEAPGSAVVRPSMKLDHAGMVFSPLIRKANYPVAPQMWEALCTLLLKDPRAIGRH